MVQFSIDMIVLLLIKLLGAQPKMGDKVVLLGEAPPPYGWVKANL